jgi:hypothetical protein
MARILPQERKRILEGEGGGVGEDFFGTVLSADPPVR